MRVWLAVVSTIASILTNILVCTPASAGSSASMQISATIVDSCNFQTTGSVLFGTLDRSSGLDASITESAAASFRCTSGTPYNITDNGGLTGTYKLQDGAGHLIDYSLAYTTTGAGSGTLTDLSVAGTIVYSSYQNAPVGVYSDTVVLTINY